MIRVQPRECLTTGPPDNNYARFQLSSWSFLFYIDSRPTEHTSTIDYIKLGHANQRPIYTIINCQSNLKLIDNNEKKKGND